MTTTQSSLAKFLAILLFAASLMVGGVATALAGKIMAADKALEMAQKGELILIDVRRPSEWRESGVASVAIPLTMHDRHFLTGLDKLKAEHPGKPIAMICATGGRTAFLQKELAKRGYGELIDVSEGMYGNGRAPGWLKRGLPLKRVSN